MRQHIVKYRFHIAFTLSLALHGLAFIFCPHLFGNEGEKSGEQHYEVAFAVADPASATDDCDTESIPTTSSAPEDESGFQPATFKDITSQEQPRKEQKTEQKKCSPKPKLQQTTQGIKGEGAGTEEPGILKLQQAKLLKPLPLPPYPLLARSRGLQGSVTCQVLITANGSIKDIKIVKHEGSTIFVDTVLAVIKKKWHGVFAPHLKAGVAVDGWVEITIPFVLK